MGDIFNKDGEVKIFTGPKFADKFLNAKLSAETIAIATAKNWQVVSV